MNLRVIHLIRKVERIDRDMEELDALLGTLQMDREYSLRLRDSLIEESFRLKQLRQKISSQVIRIPQHFEEFVGETVPGARGRAEIRSGDKDSAGETRTEKPAISAPPEEGATARAEPIKTPPALPPQEKPPSTEHSPVPDKPNGQVIVPVERPGRRGDKKKPPFLFRFE